jgi:hypothetical protein
MKLISFSPSRSNNYETLKDSDVQNIHKFTEEDLSKLTSSPSPATAPRKKHSAHEVTPPKQSLHRKSSYTSNAGNGPEGSPSNARKGSNKDGPEGSPSNARKGSNKDVSEGPPSRKSSAGVVITAQTAEYLAKQFINPMSDISFSAEELSRGPSRKGSPNFSSGALSKLDSFNRNPQTGTFLLAKCVTTLLSSPTNTVHMCVIITDSFS